MNETKLSVCRPATKRVAQRFVQTQQRDTPKSKQKSYFFSINKAWSTSVTLNFHFCYSMGQMTKACSREKEVSASAHAWRGIERNSVNHFTLHALAADDDEVDLIAEINFDVDRFSQIFCEKNGQT